MKMKNTTMTSFYQLLGRVFFAAAKADSVIRPEEVEALKKIVKELWLDVDDAVDNYDSDAAFQIEIVFDYLVNNEVVVDNVINELKTYKSIHSVIFTERIIGLILETTSRIISSFAKRNKSELVFFSQLQFALKN
jgi:hypothetical protein